MTQPVEAQGSVRAELEKRAAERDSGRTGLWAWLRGALDFAAYRPAAAPGIVISPLEDRNGPYYILKNPQTHTYYRLTDRDYYLWGLLDGTRTVKELVVAYFMEYGSFAFNRVATLVSALKANGFLTDPPINVYSTVTNELARRNPRARATRIWQGFLQTPIAINGVDGLFERVYKRGGWLLFTRPAQALYVALSLVGIYLFGRLFAEGKYSLLSAGGSVGLGLVLLLLAQFLSIMLHELSHGLTVKHYGREVRKAGMLLYMGLPAFFVDTTDIWLEPRRARLAVTWAGPYSGLVLASLACIALVIWPDLALGSLLFKFAFMCYLLVFVNLNPLLELDGYYLLMDWLGIPLLRHRSMAFITEGLPARWRAGVAARKSFVGGFSGLRGLSREEKIFSVFGLLAAAWTAYAVFIGLRFWQTQLTDSVTSLWRGGNDLGRTFLTVVAILLGAVLLSSMLVLPARLARNAWKKAERRGAFATMRRVGLWSGVAVIAASIVAAVSGSNDLWLALSLAGLLAAFGLALRNARNFSGSHLAWFFRLGAGAMAAFFAAILADAGFLAVILPAGSSPILAFWSAGVCLLVVSAVVIIAHSDLRALRVSEWAGLALGVLGTLALAVIELQGALGAATFSEAAALTLSRAGPLLALALLFPTIASFWPTTFGPSWAAFAVGIAGLMALPQAGLPLTPAFLFLAAGLGGYHVAYTRLFRDARPAPVVAGGDDRESLRNAFKRMATSITEQLWQTAGERESDARLRRFNELAAATGWRTVAGREGLRDLGGEETVVEQGQRYAASMNLLIDIVGAETGDRLALYSLQKAYDKLPWDEREVAATYLLPHVRRAGSLSAQFRSTQQNYRALLKRMPIFATMSPAELDLLASRLRRERVRAGQAIIRQGERGDKFYIVNDGHVEVSVRRDNGVVDVVGQIDRGGYFGELALLNNAPRNATCRATVPTEILSLSRQEFDALVRNRFALREKVDEAVRRVELLRNIPLFADMDIGQLQEIAAALCEESYEPGTALMREGEVGDGFHVIQRGQVEVLVAKDSAERSIARLGPGEYVGEIALLMKVPRTATVRAVTSVTTLTLHAEDFDRLVAQHASSWDLAQEATRRLTRMRRIRENISNTTQTTTESV